MKLSLTARFGALFIFLVAPQVLFAAGEGMGDAVLSEAAERGKSAVAVCMACHNQELDPPQGPPLFGVQKRYKMMFPEKPVFIDRMVSFVSNPQLEKAIMRRPVRKMGLMPPINLPKEQLTDIASYIYEARIKPPCRHWEIAVRNAEKTGRIDSHIQKDKRMLERFCQ